MDIEREFFVEVVNAFSDLLEEDLIGIGKTYKDSELTLLFNIAMYRIALKKKWLILPERNIVDRNAQGGSGRGSFSDIAFYENEKDKEPVIEIEHENDTEIIKHVQNLLKFTESKAKYKILIAYKKRSFSDAEYEDKIRSVTNVLMEKGATNVFVFYLNEDFDCENIKESFRCMSIN
jgi:hypothetical protein